MERRKLISRRNVLKGGLMTAGAGIVGTSFAQNKALRLPTVEKQHKIHLNNLLIDFQPVNQKYGYGLTEVDVNNSKNWEEKRESLIRRSKIILGEAPLIEHEVLEATITKEIQRDDYKELKINFPSGTGDKITGYLLIPDSRKNSVPGPAILAMHSTGPGAGQTVGLIPKENRSYGMELAKRGYVVLATDTIAAGERIYPEYQSYYTDPFYERFPKWSAMGKMLHDHKKGLDYLCSLNIVDANRLGCIGHSLGAYNSFFLQAFDNRIKAAVSSCGLSPLGGNTVPFTFARNDWFVHFNPVCRDFIRTGIVPCDLHEIMALCAPGALFNYSAKNDNIYFPSSIQNSNGFTDWWQTVEETLIQIAKIYEIKGAQKNFVNITGNVGHDFPPEIREKAYNWLDSILG